MATIFIKITEPTFVRGQSVEPGAVVEVTRDDAENILSAGRAVRADAPAPAPASPEAPEPPESHDPKPAKKAKN